MGAASTKIHGVLMTVAWMGCSSCGQIFAKHYRGAFPKTTFFGKDFWFVAHVACMAAAVLLTLVSFILIYAWEAHQVKHIHAYLGIVITILVVLQPVGGLLRPNLENEKRIFFNWGHWLGGNVIHLLSIVNICLAVGFRTVRHKGSFLYVLTAYVLIYVLTDFLISKLPSKASRTPLSVDPSEEGNSSRQGWATDMSPDEGKNGGQHQGSSANWQQKLIEATPKIKQYVLFLYIFACGLLTFLLSFVIAGWGAFGQYETW